MKPTTGLIIESLLLALALCVLGLRFWVRIYHERRCPSIFDGLALNTWFCAISFCVCVYISLSLTSGPPGKLDPVKYGNTTLAYTIAFDTGNFFPKLSIMFLYWTLIPKPFKILKIVLGIVTVYTVSGLIASLLMNLLILLPMKKDLLRPKNPEKNIQRAHTMFISQWTLNFSADFILFCFPFFLLSFLQLYRSQKIGLLGVFSLGAVSLAVSLTRFVTLITAFYALDPPTAYTLCTTEMCTAIIVVFLPGLKSFIMGTRSSKAVPALAYARGSNHNRVTMSNTNTKSRIAPDIYFEHGPLDDELGLVSNA